MNLQRKLWTNRTLRKAALATALLVSADRLVNSNDIQAPVNTPAPVATTKTVHRSNITNTIDHLLEPVTNLKYLSAKQTNADASWILKEYAGTADTTKPVNFKQQLYALWQRKLKLGKSKDVRELSVELPAEYNARTARRMPLAAVGQELAKAKQRVDQSLDWQAFQKAYKLTDEQTSTVQRFAHRVRQEDLLALSATEVFPSTNAQENIKLYDHFARTAGLGFIERIPALKDKLPSFGTFQHTPYSVGETKFAYGGANQAAVALPVNLRPPKSMTQLRGEKHNEAVYLNLLDVTARLARNNARPDTLNDDRLTEYIAKVHHNPCAAKRMFSSAYSSHCVLAPKRADEVNLYAAKTLANRNAYRQYVAQRQQQREVYRGARSLSD